MKLSGGQGGHLGGVGGALRARAGVGAAGVGDDALGVAGGQVLLAQQDRRGLHLVGGEDASGGAGRRGDQQGQVLLLRADRS